MANNHNSITTDDLRDEYDKSVTFNCKEGDEAFTDGYVLWLENYLLDLINEDKDPIIRFG